MKRNLLCVLAAVAVVFGASAGGVLAQEAPSAELCTALDEFETAIRAIDGDSVEEIQGQFDAAQVEFDEVREIAGEQYKAELDTMAEAMDQFRTSLADAAAGGPTDLLDLVDEIAELAVAAELLQEQIDCIGIGVGATTSTPTTSTTSTTTPTTTTTTPTTTTTTPTTTTTSTTTTVVPTAVNTGSPLDSPLSLTLVAIALGGLVVTGGAMLARRRV